MSEIAWKKYLSCSFVYEKLKAKLETNSEQLGKCVHFYNGICGMEVICPGLDPRCWL